MNRSPRSTKKQPVNSRRAQFNIVLTDSLTIRYYQRLTDAMVDLWHRGRRYDEIQMYMEGYIASLRHSNALEAYKTHRLEEETYRFLRDPSNFELAMPQTQMETQTDYY